MSHPPFPFQMMLTRAEEERDARRREYVRQREALRDHQREGVRRKESLDELFVQLNEQRNLRPRGAWEQNHTLYAQGQSTELREHRDREMNLAEKVESARKVLLQSSLRLRVWETLRDRFLREREQLLRRRQEAELEDWTRARFKSSNPRAVI